MLLIGIYASLIISKEEKFSVIHRVEWIQLYDGMEFNKKFKMNKLLIWNL